MRAQLETQIQVTALTTPDTRQCSLANRQGRAHEKREQTLINIQKRQEVVNKYFDRSATVKYFHKDQFVLLWNKENKIFIKLKV
jgi:hypothetical protein